MTTKKISLGGQDLDLAIESVLCKIGQNGKAIRMITNSEAIDALENEQKYLRSLLAYLTKKED